MSVPPKDAIVEHEADNATIGHGAQLVRAHTEIRHVVRQELASHRQKNRERT
jgi:hypothetical protein